MSHKVYFRNSDSKAIVVNIKQKILYERALGTINAKFGIPKDSIKLMYNGQTYTGDFELNPQLPHHIVHIVDKRNFGPGEFNVALSVKAGKAPIQFKDLKANRKATVQQFIDSVVKEKFKNGNITSEKAKLIHNGVQLPGDTKLQDSDVGNNSLLSLVLLQDTFLDPEDVYTCTDELYMTIQPIITELYNLPKWESVRPLIDQLRITPFFRKFQQQYQLERFAIIPSEFGPYVWPNNNTGGQGGEQQPVQNP